MEAWPRDTLRNAEPSYSNVVRKGNCAKPLSHSTEICERWLGHVSYIVECILCLILSMCSPFFIYSTLSVFNKKSMNFYVTKQKTSDLIIIVQFII